MPYENPSSYANLHKGNPFLSGLWGVKRPSLFGIMLELSIM